MLDRVVRVELLRSAQGFEDSTDTPAQVLPVSVCHQLASGGSVFDGEESAIHEIWDTCRKREQVARDWPYRSLDHRTRLKKKLGEPEGTDDVK